MSRETKDLRQTTLGPDCISRHANAQTLFFCCMFFLSAAEIKHGSYLCTKVLTMGQ